jgi:hypothetical protein
MQVCYQRTCMYVSTHMHQCVHACRRVYVSTHTEGMGAGCFQGGQKVCFCVGDKTYNDPLHRLCVV